MDRWVTPTNLSIWDRREPALDFIQTYFVHFPGPLMYAARNDGNLFHISVVRLVCRKFGKSLACQFKQRNGCLLPWSGKSSTACY